jgi:hypothetical protein
MKDTKPDIASCPPPNAHKPKKKQSIIDSFDVKTSFTGGEIELVIKHGSRKSYPITSGIAREMGKALLASADFFDKTQ